MKINKCGSILPGIFLTLAVQAAGAATFVAVHGGCLAKVSHLTPTGRLAGTNQLRLALSLALRDPDGLAAFVAKVSDPASPNYRQYLTPEQVTTRFGPTEQDYQDVKDFARSNGLGVAATFGNRLVLDVVAPASAVEKAFNVTLRRYRHPTEAREFFAPDSAPTVDASLAIVDVGGLDNFSRPHSMRPKHRPERGSPQNGSSPDGHGAIFGDDFRNAYAPGTKLTGIGQTVGLFEWDGSYSVAVAAYAAMAGGGRTNIPIQYVLLDGFNGVATLGYDSGEPEVDMDIEMVMAMAPGLSKIVVFEGNPYTASPIDILNAMASSNTIRNLSSSWSWSSDDLARTNSDAVFLTMAAQGQTYFQASGDGEAYTVGAASVDGVDNPNNANGNVPFSSPYVTVTGGTLLAMNGTGASYASETVWNDAPSGDYEGSAGGVSSYYSIPAWQTNTSMAANQGSAMQRNIPDLAADAENIYEVTGENADGVVTGLHDATADDYGGGTSSAAPLWAGFIALVNQQAAENAQPSVGFINPAVYAIGNSSNYGACLHDTTLGNNEWPSSPSQYSAVAGYDLCTGWGTPGVNLIDALTTPAAIDLLNPQTAGSNIQFHFLSRPGFTHAVLFRSDLASGNWQLYTNITGDGTLKTVSVPRSVFGSSSHGFVTVLTQ